MFSELLTKRHKKHCAKQFVSTFYSQRVFFKQEVTRNVFGCRIKKLYKGVTKATPIGYNSVDGLSVSDPNARIVETRRSMIMAKKKATRKKATRKKATRKKATRKKATRKKATRKKATRRRRK